MRSRKKILGLLPILAVILSIFGALYWHFGLLPGRARDYTIQKIEQLTRYHVRFDKALILPFRGFCFYGLEVRQPDGSLLFSAQRLSVAAKILPFFMEKKIIITNLGLDGASYDLSFAPAEPLVPKQPVKTKISGQIDVPVVEDAKKVTWESLEEGPEAFLPENVYLEQIQIRHSSVTVREKPGTPVLEEIRSIDLRMAFHKPPVLELDGSLELGHSPYAAVEWHGQWDLKTARYEFDFKSHSDEVPAWLHSYQAKNFLIFQQGSVTAHGHMKSVTESRALFHADLDLEDAEILQGHTRYSGKMRLAAKGVFDFSTRFFERYQGELSLFDITLRDLSPSIQELRRIDGKVEFQPDLFTVRSLKGEYKNIPFEARGTIRSFKDLLVNGDIRSVLSIEEAIGLLGAEQSKKLKDFELSGHCQSVTEIRGSLKDRERLSMRYKLLLTHGTMRKKGTPLDLHDLSAEVLVDARGMKIMNARFAAAETRYGLDLFLPKDRSVPGDLKLRSRDMSLSADYLLSGENEVLIRSAVANAWGIGLDFEGQLNDWSKPFLNIHGHANASLENIRLSDAAAAERIRSAGLRGRLSGLFTFTGVWNDAKTWDLKFDASGDPVFVQKTVRIDGAELQLRMKNQIIDIPYFHGRPYGGTLGAKALFDLSQKGVYYDGNFYATGVDLGALGKDLPSKKDLSGKLVFQSTLKGLLNSTESVNGKGAVSITGGKLWQTDQFQAMGHLPFVTVEGLDKVTFHDMSATFNIHDKRIWTQDLSLLSDTVDLSLKGSMGFDQTLDFRMGIRYSNAVMRGALDTGGLVPMVVNEASEFISEYKISGTLKEPRSDKMMLPVGRVIGRKISGLFQRLAS